MLLDSWDNDHQSRVVYTVAKVQGLPQHGHTRVWHYTIGKNYDTHLPANVVTLAVLFEIVDLFPWRVGLGNMALEQFVD